MIRLVKNEIIKMGKIKLIFPYVLFSLIIIIQYFLVDNIVFENVISIIPFCGIILCVIFSGLISNEIENGTFRFYLTKSKSRNKIYFSKLLFSFVYIFIFTIYLYVLYYLLNKSINMKDIVKYLLYTTPIYFIISLSSMLSNIIKYTPINSGLCIILYAFGASLSELLFKNNIRFIQYSFLPYLDFSIFLDKEYINYINFEYMINLNLKYGIIINIIFIFIFNLIGYVIFVKKDIKS